MYQFRHGKNTREQTLCTFQKVSLSLGILDVDEFSNRSLKPWRIRQRLLREEATVLADALHVAQSGISKHLRILRDARIVGAEKAVPPFGAKSPGIPPSLPRRRYDP